MYAQIHAQVLIHLSLSFLSFLSCTRTQVLCVSPIEPSVDPAVALMAESGQAAWKCLIGGKRIKPGSRLIMKADVPGSKEKVTRR